MIDPDLALLLTEVLRDQSDRTLKLVAADRCQELGPDYARCEWLLRYTASLSFTRPLLSTGSRVYGEPRLDSDWDWVVLSVGTTTRRHLTDNSDSCNLPRSDTVYPDGTIESRLDGTYRFGPINVIHAGDHVQWEIWKEGTELLLAESGSHGPRTRDRAIEVFTAITHTKYSQYAHQTIEGGA